MDGFEIYEELDSEFNLLSDAKSRMVRFGKEKAKAQAEYKAYKAAKTLELRMDGMPATLIKDAIYDDEELVKLMYLRDASETLYDATREEIMIHKKRIDFLREQMQETYRGD